MPKQRASTRKERRKQQHENYLAGRASRPYCHTTTLNRSFSDNDEREQGGNESGSSAAAATPGSASDATATMERSKVCSRCLPALSRYKTTFEGLVHTGSTRKSRRSRNLHPKRVTTMDNIHVNVDW